jgi:hypothetical protein
MKWRSKELELEKRELTLNLVSSKARTLTFSKMTGVGINFIYTSWFANKIYSLTISLYV